MSWWNDLVAGFDIASNNPGAAFQQVLTGKDPFSSWLTSTAGNIASGIEAAVTAFLTDIWDVIIGPVEVIVGAIIFLMGVTLLVKDDLTGVIGLVGMMG